MRRACWVWGRPAPTELIAWVRAHDIAELFVSVRPGPGDSDDRWTRSVVRQAHDVGTRVAALGGDDGWIDQPEHALSWARSVTGAGVFDGVHLDLEAWVHPAWDEQRDRVVHGYLEVLRNVKTVCAVPLEADIALWLHRVSASGVPLDEAVMRIVDAVTVLSYRNTATGTDSITEVGAHELATAGRVGVSCRLAVETNDLGRDPAQVKQTFYGLGRVALDAALSTVDRVERDVPAYLGIAIQDYRGWRDLRRDFAGNH